MNIRRFVANTIGENCYIVWDDTLEGVIIDCGAWDEAKEVKIAQFIEDNKIRPRYALQTHMHFDHIFGLPFLQQQYGLHPMCHALEQPVYEAMPAMARDWFGFTMPEPLVPIQEYLSDQQELTFGHTTIRVLFTPGHTPGGLCFYFPDDKVLFSGDTLFQGSIGRADLPGGNMDALIESIRTKILSLPDEVVIYPGHGPSTTVGEERRMNPYLY